MKKTKLKKLVIFTIIIIIFSIYTPSFNAKIISKNNFFQLDSTLDEEIINIMNCGNFPGLSACIIRNDTIIWSNSYGFSNIRTGKDAKNSDIYLAGSISKTITSTAIMQLYEQDYFDLDDDINDYLPFNIRNPHYQDVPITFRMLLAHRASLSDCEARLFILFSICKYSLEDLDEFLIPGGKIYNPAVWKNIQPGSETHYSSVGYEILEYLLELFTNKPFVEYCKENIFVPLEMDDTSFILDELNQDKLATPYLCIFDKYIPLPNYEDKNYASGGLQTNIYDLSHFLIAHMNGGVYKGKRILDESTVELMHAIQYPESDYSGFAFYGLGWKIFKYISYGPSIIGHSGAVPGGTSYMFYNPSTDIGVIFLINQFTFIFRDEEFNSYIELQRLLFNKGTYLT